MDYNQHPYEKKLMKRFFPKYCSVVEKIEFSYVNGKIGLVFPNFDHHIFINEQNDCDIRNQHEKLSRITYILSKTIFRQNQTRTPPQVFFTEFFP